ncbi:hypothetical protein NDA12_006752 [Ustilago hordei]|nr:hypothetical protein NDA12_006752 [Ustilago hordei]
MPKADTPQPGSAHTAMSSTAADDSNAPAWIRMLLEQQATTNRLMEERQANMLEQQAATFHLLEGILAGQGSCYLPSQSMPKHHVPNSPLLPDEARDNRHFGQSFHEE